MEIDLVQYISSEAIPHPYVCIVLNQDIDIKPFQIVYERADLKICADGGHDRLKRWYDMHEAPIIDPDFIIGDLDSVDKDACKDSKCIQIQDQNRNDLQKCIDFVLEHYSFKTFFMIGALGGRLDHELQALSVLYQYREFRLIYSNSKSLLTLLTTGQYTIRYDPSILGSHCGAGPLKGIANVTTSGLKWDIDGPMEMGSSISSSNHICNDINLATDNDIIFTIEIK